MLTQSVEEIFNEDTIKQLDSLSSSKEGNVSKMMFTQIIEVLKYQQLQIKTLQSQFIRADIDKLQKRMNNFEGKLQSHKNYVNDLVSNIDENHHDFYAHQSDFENVDKRVSELQKQIDIHNIKFHLALDSIVPHFAWSGYDKNDLDIFYCYDRHFTNENIKNAEKKSLQTTSSASLNTTPGFTPSYTPEDSSPEGPTPSGLTTPFSLSPPTETDQELVSDGSFSSEYSGLDTLSFNKKLKNLKPSKKRLPKRYRLRTTKSGKQSKYGSQSVPLKEYNTDKISSTSANLSRFLSDRLITPAVLNRVHSMRIHAFSKTRTSKEDALSFKQSADKIKRNKKNRNVFRPGKIKKGYFTPPEKKNKTRFTQMIESNKAFKQALKKDVNAIASRWE